MGENMRTYVYMYVHFLVDVTGYQNVLTDYFVGDFSFLSTKLCL